MLHCSTDLPEKKGTYIIITIIIVVVAVVIIIILEIMTERVLIPEDKWVICVFFDVSISTLLSA